LWQLGSRSGITASVIELFDVIHSMIAGLGGGGLTPAVTTLWQTNVNTHACIARHSLQARQIHAGTLTAL
jgi:hypothetical protein